MYWYKPLNKITTYLIAGVVLMLAINSCKNDSHSAADTNKFFDIKGYFKAESARLTKSNPPVDKTVVHNNTTETQKVHISNWDNELSSFTESDINKPAWKASYTVTVTDDLLIYKAKDPELKTQEIMIKKDHNKIKWILIVNHPKKNILYENAEKLSYFPDSLYLIQKKLMVRVLGINRYKISGSLNQ
jgi:hypothetical protein